MYYFRSVKNKACRLKVNNRLFLFSQNNMSYAKKTKPHCLPQSDPANANETHYSNESSSFF